MFGIHAPLFSARGDGSIRKLHLYSLSYRSELHGVAPSITQYTPSPRKASLLINFTTKSAEMARLGT